MKSFLPASAASRTSRGFSICTLALVALALGSSAAHAATVYRESDSGDFSGSGLSPTVVSGFGVGSNEVYGATGNLNPTPATVDRDYFTFMVPAGLEWVSLTALQGMAPAKVAFIGLQAGSQVTLPTSTVTATGLLGWHHYASADAGKDLLPLMSAPSNGSSGFSTPLGAGTYAIWIQDSTQGETAYGLNFQLRAVPDAGPGLGFLGAVLGLAFFARRIRGSAA